MQPIPLGQTDNLDSLSATIKRFRQNLALYAVACLAIRDKSGRTHSLKFNEAQTMLHELLGEQLEETGRIRCIVLKARQEGVSTYVAARFFRRLNLWPGQAAMVVADTLQRAGVLYDIYARYYENLPGEIKPVKKSVARQRFLGFTHDSDLSVRPSSDTEAGRAMTLHLLHASELAYWGPGARETWVSLMQAIPHVGSEVIVESTAKGAGGLFHELWEAAETGESGWLAVFLPWWIHGEYESTVSDEVTKRILGSPDEFEQQALGDGIPFRGKYHKLSLRKLTWRREIIIEKFGGNPETLGRDAIRAFQQEYPATAEEAFLVSGSCFFDEDQLRVLSRKVWDAKTRGRLILGEDGKLLLEPNVRGFVRVFDSPERERHYVIGGDTAEGKLVASRSIGDSAEAERGGRDYSAACVYRLPYEVEIKDELNFVIATEHHPGRVVAELHGRIAPEVFAEQLRLLGQFYSCGSTKAGSTTSKALIGVERSHSSGQTVLRLLRESYSYLPLYWHREINRLTKKVGKQLGWITSATSRMPMLDYLAAEIRAKDIEIPSKDVVRELVTFVLWDNGKPMAEEGCHDDRVIALAIALQMAKEHRHMADTEIPKWEPSEFQ